MFALTRVARASPASSQSEWTSSGRLGANDVTSGSVLLAPLQRQQRLAAELLQVHLMSDALVYEPHTPLGVDAAAWWRELKQLSIAAVSQRQSRKRRLQGSSSSSDATTGPLFLPGNYPGVAPREEREPLVQDVLVETLVRVLQSLSAWTASRSEGKLTAVDPETIDPEMVQVLENVEKAIGDVGVKLLDEWWHAPLHAASAGEDEASQTAAACGVQVVNVLLQLHPQVGSFHAFHAHKLCCSTAQRLFRAKSRWSCSKCERSWETQTANGPILVFHCAACDFTLCRECYTRVPNATTELQEIAIAREPFASRTLHSTDAFLPLVLRHVQASDPLLFAAVAPKIAIAARDRLQDLLLYRSEEMVPMLQMVVELFAIPGFPRVFIEKEPLQWLPQFISSAKIRLNSFLGPLMWWTSMSDEPGEINLSADSRRNASSNALTLQWLDGYRVLRPLLAQLFGLLLDTKTQEPFVVDATLNYLATMICCFSITRNSGHNTADLYDGILINLSIALIDNVLPLLATSAQRQQIETVYHESSLARRVYLERPESLWSRDEQEEKRIREADDSRIHAKDVKLLAQLAKDPTSSDAFDHYYPPAEKHGGVLCDHCHEADLVGARYKCAMCSDADICTKCFEIFSKQAFASTQNTGTASAAETAAPLVHRTDHVFFRVNIPVPLIAVYHFLPIDFTDQRPFSYEEADSAITAESITRELQCAGCDTHLDQFEVMFRCSNCLEPRFMCPSCVEHEERLHHPSRAHLPGHLYMAIPRVWSQNLNPRAHALYCRNLLYQACVYPRERLSVETELVYMTIRALHVGPIHSFSKFVVVAKEMHELRAFCACEEQRVETEKRAYEQNSFEHLPPSRRPPAPKLSAHYIASQARLADLGATRLMAEMHLLESTNVFSMLTFYARTCRWLLELASPTQNAFSSIITDFSRTFSSFPEHFFFDVCDMVHVLTFDGTSGGKPGLGGVDFQNSDVIVGHYDDQYDNVEALMVMLLQLMATRKCTKNPHLRVQAAKALSALLSFYTKNVKLASPVRNAFLRCQVLKIYAVGAVLQFHEDMEGYHIRNNGLVFNNNAGSGDHLLWGFVGIRVTTVLLLRCMWQFGRPHTALVRAFHARTPSPQHVTSPGNPDVDLNSEARVASQVSMLILGLWSDAAKLSEEGNTKVGVLNQLADIRVAVQEGRQIQLPFRPSMLDGYIALHSKHLRVSMRMLVEVVELLSWLADHTPLKRAMLKSELVDQCSRTVSFLLSSLATGFKDETLDSTWHHLQDSKRLYAHLVILVARCAGRASYNISKSTKTVSPSQYWSLVHESGNTMLRYIGDVDAHDRWQLNRSVARMESAKHLGAGTGEGHGVHTARSMTNWLGNSVSDDEDEEEEEAVDASGTNDLDENAALALLEQHSAQALSSIANQAGTSLIGAPSQPARKRQRALGLRLGNRFISALSKDGRFVAETFLDGRELLRLGELKTTTNEDAEYEYVGSSWMALYTEVLDRCQDMVKLQAVTDELLADIPDEYLDPLLSTIMTDPVRLPSGNIVDRAVIERHLLSAPSNRMDPFTREPLTLDMLTPCDGLRREIKMYLRSKLQHLENKEDDGLASWGLGWDSIFDAMADPKAEIE